MAQAKSILENISIIVGIAVGIGGAVITLLTYLHNKKKKEEKAPEEQKNNVAGESVVTGGSIIEHEEAGRDVLKAGGDVLAVFRLG